MICIKKILTSLFAALCSNNFAQNNSSKASDVLAVALPTYATASYLKDDEQGLAQLIQSEAVTLGVVEVLKASVHKTRPDGSDNKSFPSGHAAVAFSAAQYMQMKGGWEYGAPADGVASYALTDSSTGNRLSMMWESGAASVVWALVFADKWGWW